MFHAGTGPPTVADAGLGCEPQQFRDLDHNLDGLDKVTSARDEVVGTDTHAFLDEIPAGRSLLEQFAEAAKEVIDGGVDEWRSEELFRRLTFEGRRSELSVGTIVYDSARRSISDGQGTPMRETEEWMEMHQRPETPASKKSRKISSGILKGKFAAIPRYDGSSSADPRSQSKRSSSAPEARLSKKGKNPSRRSGDSSVDSGFPERNMNKLLLYNWFLLRLDNIKILSSISDNLRGKGDDFGLLKLLAGTHEERRWWTILVDNLACPQCVEVLRARRIDTHLSKDVKKATRKCQSPCTRFITKLSRTIHSDGGQCRIKCNHLAPKSNHVCSLSISSPGLPSSFTENLLQCYFMLTPTKVTRFFAKLGQDTAFRMKNILLETQLNEVPDPDKLVSAVQNVEYYFPDVQNLEIAFYFGDQVLDYDTRTRILCSLVQLEGLLPKGRHLRVLGMGGCLEMMNGWTRRGRRWHE